MLNPAQNKHNTCDASTASGSAVATLTKNKFCIYLSYSGIAKELYSHIHGPAPVGASANVLFGLSSKSTKRDCVTLTNAQVNMLNAGLLYVNVHTSNFKGGCTDGEIRGQFFPVKHT